MTAGRTLSVSARMLTELPPCEVVQLAGIAGPVHSTAIEIVRRVSAASTGPAYPLYAPLVLSDRTSAAALRNQPQIRRTLRRIDDVTVAVTAIGSWRPPDSQMYDNAAVAGPRRTRMLQRGALADLGAVLLDEGSHVLTGIADLCIGATAEQMRAIPDVVGVAGGPTKHRAILTALRSGLVGSLVTDTETARFLIETA